MGASAAAGAGVRAPPGLVERSAGRGARAAPGVRCAAAAALAALLGAGALGCQRELSMARAYDERRPGTTIRYRGVRGEARLYPDYSSIDASILTSSAAEPGAGTARGRAP